MPNTVAPGGSLRIAQKDNRALKAGQLPEQLFFEAVLARVEVNKNRDEFTETHLRELAATIAHMPVDDDHKMPVIQGHILEARYDPEVQNPSGTKGALLFAGVTYPRRFPAVAAGLIDGTMKFSVESLGEEVECSSCHSRYAVTEEESAYCACLQARKVTNVTSRLWHNNKGIGAAFTPNPAGSDCDVEPGSLLLVASYDEPASPIDVSGMLFAHEFADAPKENPAQMDPKKIAALLASVVENLRAGTDFHSSDTAEEALLAAVKPSLVTLVEAVKADGVKEVEKVRTELTASHTTALEAVKAEGQKALLAEQRVAELKALPHAVPNPESVRTLVANLADDVWQFTLAGYKSAEEHLIPNVGVPGTPAAPVAPVTPPATPPATPDAPAGGTLLANAANGTGAGTPAPTPVQGNPGNAGTPAAKSFSEMTLTIGSDAPASK